MPSKCFSHFANEDALIQAHAVSSGEEQRRGWVGKWHESDKSQKNGRLGLLLLFRVFLLATPRRNRLSKLPLQGVMSPLPRFPFPQPHPSPRIVLGRCRRYSYTRLQSGFGPPWEDPLSPASFPSASSSCLFVSQGVLAQASPVCAHQRYTTTTKPGPACPATTSFPPIHGPITVQH